jgi:hypothetical protein
VNRRESIVDGEDAAGIRGHFARRWGAAGSVALPAAAGLRAPFDSRTLAQGHALLALIKPGVEGVSALPSCTNDDGDIGGPAHVSVAPHQRLPLLHFIIVVMAHAVRQMQSGYSIPISNKLSSGLEKR